MKTEKLRDYNLAFLTRDFDAFPDTLIKFREVCALKVVSRYEPCFNALAIYIQDKDIEAVQSLCSIHLMD